MPSEAASPADFPLLAARRRLPLDGVDGAGSPSVETDNCLPGARRVPQFVQRTASLAKSAWHFGQTLPPRRAEAAADCEATAGTGEEAASKPSSAREPTAGTAA